MKRLFVFVLAAAALLTLAACRKEAEKKAPALQEPTQEQTDAPTRNPFEGESEIDFSDFDTQPAVTEPVASEPSESEPEDVIPEDEDPTKPSVPSATKPSVPEPTEPEITEPEPTEPETTAAPSVGKDGYHNQIVRP